ncbi:GTP-binding protein [Sulfurimonas sp.]|mgnify:FL=1|jgi:G3E family GTPase|uniref:CobW family GTP-binding protein n=1 Tax=Sulfurimonas sp. TaxID=2022749 RepID=UPI0025FD8533|nr:GTP-binding protein [Sulfurimonas sp.]MBT5935059.1 GTP-binding protein [Sulfurimonas sp.]
MVQSFIITGFLGVGKTTMLTNTVKEHFSDKKVAIVVNEFGDIGIDGDILSNVYSEVLEISEGCICCQLAEEFESGVIEIMNKYNPEIIFVETSGASEPFPIFLSMQNLGISVEGVICVVDSKNLNSYKDNSTAQYQIGGSNIIVLNKTDLVDDKELEAVKQDVIKIKEEFNIKNTMTGKTVFNSYVINSAERGIVNKEVFEGIYKIDEIIGLANDYKHDNHTTEDSITQKVAYLKEDIVFNDVDEILNNIPDSVYRVKGIVKVKDVANPLVINYSFGNVSFDELDAYEEPSIMIFIGESIDNDVIELCSKFEYLNMPQFRVGK